MFSLNRLETDTAPVKMEVGRSVAHDSVIYFAPFDLGVIYYFSSRNKWNLLKEPMKCKNSGLAIIKGHVATIGGVFQGMYTRQVWIWNKEWEEGEDTIEERSDPAVLSGENYVIVVSGKGPAKVEAHWTTSVEVYDVREKKWNPVCPLPSPLGRPEVTLCNGTIYVFPDEFGEGMKCNLDNLISCKAENKSSVWKEFTNCPLRYSTPATVKNRVVCFGGTDGHGLGSEDIYVYEDVGLWFWVGQLRSGRMYSMVEVCDNKIFVVGGCSKLTNQRKPPNLMDEVDIYTLN